MNAASETVSTPLAIAPIAQNLQLGRWRTEAMRSYATPRFLMFTKGQGRITIAGLTRGYGPNNLIYIPANTMFGFEVGPTVFGQMLTIPSAMAAEWPEEPVHLRLRDVLVQKECLSLIESLERELKSARNAHSRAAHYHLGLMAIFFERQIGDLQADVAPDPRNSTTAKLVAAYTDLIAEGYRSDRGVAEYAAALGVTATHLTRCCNQTCGKSALAILSDRVHYEACKLLRDTKMPVNKIAADLGFHSAAYFTRSFQARSGKTPSAFRKRGAAPARN